MIQAPNPLSDFEWKNRIILISGPEGLISRQESEMRKYEDDMEDRDLLLFTLHQNSVMLNGKSSPFDVREIRTHFNISTDQFQVLLVGKDGGIKVSLYEITEAGTFFKLIDSMPMRKWEMKKKD